MKIIIFKPNDYARNFLRRCGYAAFEDPGTGESSFVRRLTTEFYPRFHVYAKEDDDKLEINLHLDQKKPSYGEGSHAHSGEYDGELVETEGLRLQNEIAYLIKERRGED
ncbi:MAG: hypothetical protein UT86_C0001G0253 [Candidatus Magasanikbacteria bacterium GW2011_GWC2_40_17]|uniref:Uncharacterized protein n=1 Tax=Candidatus Magasanikbacteria bacterium GW2011_GWA2_42_32 TaxID=1619039 RepID=A0A0G1D6F8_9BACT|nr:MAG: hypothetical protein UT86_C0001G0253 [Candidatus Magasanikbacteria bacterium GW2011_GWC2_40_17]KKS57613.1 MAG: hypothetical protein UV20_C0001G0253 [Candidatus Magasanikbacteria bacterium GW2011_GWA2_42_32]OGH85015.1 MAG: hypothetical protein A2294_01825 [Candidatus Magasanikbacteria bacterium RIFOXYB2_FULL_38_10]